VALNRRGFISNLALMLGAATGPNILALEALDRFKWKAPAGRLVAVINPEWLEAPYEAAFLSQMREDFRRMIEEKLRPEIIRISNHYPMRFRTEEDALSNKNCVAPWIEKREP
jgi:hypothetical protein